MPLVIPERTVDTLFTFELISAAPRAIVVSPHNNRGREHPIMRFKAQLESLYFG